MTVDAVSTLALRAIVPEDRPDRLVTQVLVDGADPYAEVAPGWHGDYPGNLVDLPSPLPLSNTAPALMGSTGTR